MKTLEFVWTLRHMREKNAPAIDPVPATVPGAVQLDYAAAKNYEPYYFGLNFHQFDWMEDEFFLYSTELDFHAAPGEAAYLHFDGIDYRYEIRLDGVCVCQGEGIFTPVVLDVTSYAGKRVPLEVLLYPIPKREGDSGNHQPRASAKPASSYGWDWHPRLVPTGIWERAYVQIVPVGSPIKLDAAYRLSEDLKRVDVLVEAETACRGDLLCELAAPDGRIVASAKCEASATLSMEDPQLWFPRGYGAQPLYTLRVSGAGETLTRRIGFRRSKLIRNAEDSRRFEKHYPMQPLPAPATIEINGQKVFAKGSNWVNTEIFPCMMTDARYDELLELAYGANMNILRLWGGQYINREHFYEKCDELGIMVWQEFMLSCNLHPDDDDYLSVLGQEAVTIIKRLRTHPCLTFWAGGNELFNGWSGMTCQSHPLRLLDKLCYEYDRFTPFNMTSPLHGMAHGTYVKVEVESGSDDPAVDDVKGREFIEVLKECDYNTYTEFGCNGAATPEYLKKYIMDDSTYRDCTPENPVWKAHHAFYAWNDGNWLGKREVKFYFGGWDSMEDLLEKTLFLQSLTYKTHFEEMRRKWPHCSMAVNWDFNEPWPCAAGNSLVNWPCEPKKALDSVRDALRPTLISLCAPHNRFLTGETFTGQIWVLNDAPEPSPEMDIDVSLEADGVRTPLGRIHADRVAPRSNAAFETVSFPVTASLPQRFRVVCACETHREFESCYDYVRK